MTRKSGSPLRVGSVARWSASAAAARVRVRSQLPDPSWGESAFERESTARPLYEADAYRSSDHDPVVVGLALRSPNRAPVARITGPATVCVGRTVELDAGTSSDPNRLDVLSYAWDLDGDGAFDDATGPTASFKGIRGPGAKAVAVQVSDGTLTSVARTTVTVTVKQPRAQ